ncbi:MAG: type II secretion system ATPase GspE [Deltaproteobacteria bacterium]|nr:type II secretion system ATPase GspE [Deltaproteobacteria bacterium]
MIPPPPPPMPATQSSIDPRPLGAILVAQGYCKAEAIDAALEVQGERGGLIGELLVGSGSITALQLIRALGSQFGIEVQDAIDHETIDPSLVGPLSMSYAREGGVLPIHLEDGVLQVAVSNPVAVDILDDLRVLFDQARIEPFLVTQEVLHEAINYAFDRRARADQVVDDMAKEEGVGEIAAELEDGKDILDEDDEAPIIRLVNSVLNQAAKEKASDIHIEPMEKYVLIRFRKDGVLREIVRAPKRFQPSITSRIKIMGNLNIAEKRLPQDGRIRIKVAGRDIDLRLSTIPTAHGERIVMRLLDKSSTTLDLRTLGMREEVVNTLDGLIRRPNGIILVTGPTGSGKTTTLYSALVTINHPDVNILTIEDPVEYQLEGIGQMQVQPKIGFTFASGLRATLRQDPDVVLVGEIRDLETAEIAVQASLTGHLVLSTVHTNDASSTFTRMVDMGVEPFLLSSSVIGILAQRLIRLLCRDCKEPHRATDLELSQLGIRRDDPMLAGATFFRAKGCGQCGMSGYSGRSGLHELLVPDEEVKRLIVDKSDAGAIKKAAVRAGMKTLLMDGAIKAMRGQTTIEEVVRIATAAVD